MFLRRFGETLISHHSHWVPKRLKKIWDDSPVTLHNVLTGWYNTSAFTTRVRMYTICAIRLNTSIWCVHELPGSVLQHIQLFLNAVNMMHHRILIWSDDLFGSHSWITCSSAHLKIRSSPSIRTVDMMDKIEPWHERHVFIHDKERFKCNRCSSCYDQLKGEKIMSWCKICIIC